MSLHELESQLSLLRPAEKAEWVRRWIQDITNVFHGIEKTAGVAGGEACIARTRIPIWALENYHRLGWNEATILENYPSLRATDLVNAWA
ncbi:MAG: DUF433 domain-containing protein [Chloroflexi bacterium]|nr:DUF433 domain-containing protein [Chloroflexota bacterium]